MVFAYIKRRPSSWNFYSVGRKIDELGNFGHVSVPIMEGPCQCLRLKIGARFCDYDWFRRSALWRSFIQIFYYIGNPILHYFWELPLVRFLFSSPGFFVLRVTYLRHGFFNGLFVITLLSSGWIVRNWSRVLLRNSSKAGHMHKVTWMFLGIW